MGATTTTFEALLKEVYQPGVNSQINNSNPLLSELESTDRGVAMGEHGGRYTVIALKLGRNTAAGPLGEGATIHEPGNTRTGRATVDLTYQYATGSVTGPAEAKSKSDAKAYAKILTTEIDGVREAMTHSVGRQVWSKSNGVFATIVDVVSGTGPWVLEVDERTVQNDWLEETTKIQLVDSAETAVQDSDAVLEVTDVDVSASTVTVAQVSGTSTPANGEKIIISGSFEKALAGVAEIIQDTTTTFQEIDRSSERRWQAVRKDVSGAFSFNAYQQLRNEIRQRSGKNPDLIITTHGIERAAYNELQDQVRYTKSKDLEAGEGVILPGPGNPKLKADPQAPSGSLFAFNKSAIRMYADGEYRFMEQGGSNLLVLSRKDLVEFVLKRYMQFGVEQLNCHGEAYNITDSSYF